jgi:hypothetical protein
LARQVLAIAISLETGGRPRCLREAGNVEREQERCGKEER